MEFGNQVNKYCLKSHLIESNAPLVMGKYKYYLSAQQLQLLWRDQSVDLVKE